MGHESAPGPRLQCEGFPIVEIIIAVYRIRLVLYLAKVVHDDMLCTYPVLDVKLKFLQEQHPLG